MSVAADRSTMPALPLAGSKARSATSPIRDTVPWIATPASLRSSFSSVGGRRAPEESAPGSRRRPQWGHWEEPPLPDAVGLFTGNNASPMVFARPLKSRLYPGCPLLRVCAEKHVPFLKTSGASHGGVLEAQMPEWHPASVEVQD